MCVCGKVSMVSIYGVLYSGPDLCNARYSVFRPDLFVVRGPAPIQICWMYGVLDSDQISSIYGVLHPHPDVFHVRVLHSNPVLFKGLCR